MSLLQDIKTYRNMLRINKHRLDDELEVQSETLDRIVSNVARVRARTKELKLELERVEGRLIAEAAEDQPKALKAEIEGKVKRDPDFNKAWRAWLLSQAELDEWEGLEKAWIGRGFDLKALGELYAAQYWQFDSLQSADRKRRERSDDYERPKVDRSDYAPSKDDDRPVRRRVLV